ncbi:unnamed protein product, partial [Prorocentrum cordatum]
MALSLAASNGGVPPNGRKQMRHQPKSRAFAGNRVPDSPSFSASKSVLEPDPELTAELEMLRNEVASLRGGEALAVKPRPEAMGVDAGQPGIDAEARKQLGAVTQKPWAVANLVGEEFDELRGKLRAKQVLVEARMALGDAAKALQATAKEIADLESECCQLVAGAPVAPSGSGAASGDGGLEQLIGEGLSIWKCGEVLQSFGGSPELAQRLRACLAE